MEETLQRYAVTPGVGEVFFSTDQLRLVAEVAGPSGRVEMNSFMQLIVHTPDTDLESQHARLRAAGLGVYAVGAVVKNLHTCTFCMGDRVEGLPDARRLDQLLAGAKVPFTVRIGFSGCVNNCGEAIIRDIGVVRLSDGTYDIYAGGRPGSLEPLLGIKVGESVPAPDLVRAVEAVLETYRTNARGKERLWKNIRRIGPEPYQTSIQRS